EPDGRYTVCWSRAWRHDGTIATQRPARPAWCRHWAGERRGHVGQAPSQAQAAQAPEWATTGLAPTIAPTPTTRAARPALALCRQERVSEPGCLVCRGGWGRAVLLLFPGGCWPHGGIVLCRRRWDRVSRGVCPLPGGRSLRRFQWVWRRTGLSSGLCQSGLG